MTRIAIVLLLALGITSGIITHRGLNHPPSCLREPIPQSAWRSAATQLGVHIGDLAPGVEGYHRGPGSIDDCRIAAPLTSLDIIAHGHLKAVTLDDGTPGVEISELATKPVHIDRIPAGGSVRIEMRLAPQ